MIVLLDRKQGRQIGRRPYITFCMCHTLAQAGSNNVYLATKAKPLDPANLILGSENAILDLHPHDFLLSRTQNTHIYIVVYDGPISVKRRSSAFQSRISLTIFLKHPLCPAEAVAAAAEAVEEVVERAGDLEINLEVDLRVSRRGH